ncbi:DUF6299 family protein [Streptomyces sp. NPDC006529]|uniref:DUF6299 family protein n=1 Tax=Streptomyces sp. NPDC006529 TaxID=3157177 RepID=UPI0033B64519
MGLPVSRIAVAALSALAATAACAVPASADSRANAIVVKDRAQLSEDGRVTLSGVYRCEPGSPEGVQIQTRVRQDGNRLGMTAGEATCDGAAHEWSVTGTMGIAGQGFHAGAAEATAELTVARVHGAHLLPTAVSRTTLAEHTQPLTIQAR